MQDGTQVVGKVPNPNAGRAHNTTASEVATMDFARNCLGTPVPRVLAWSSKATENPFGAEYIIMEKVAGVPLDKIWASLDIKQRFGVVKSISRYQRAWMSTAFAEYGSLYYSSDLPNADGCILTKEDGSQIKEHFFAVGHSTEYGPTTPVAFGPIRSRPYNPSRAKKAAALQNYLRLVKFLSPLDHSISCAVLWHPDLHGENISVNPEKPWEVLGIIDWQSSELLPLFEQARQPYFLDYDGPVVEGLDPPPFPENFDQLDPAEQAEAQSLYMNMSLSALYRRFTCANNERLFRAMGCRQTSSFEMMLFAHNILVDGEALYQSRMLELEEEWQCLPGVQAAGNPPIPIRFSADEANSIEEDVVGTIRAMELMRSVKQSLGNLWPEKGVVSPGQYDQVKMLMSQAKAEIVAPLASSEQDKVAWEKAWPYDE
ncbi:uncharacterized protein LDX57_009374 [Aspergillus melleus]|uniref:uncharacterized protein n=1 Tax=Aspergillus melleus TaxID=138277 RepID=UPI001E8E3953|nr:uncharacterized protein LDX57_009374 [Aspergillus melleus]KAH8431719.1 hypothetical protein LDX57_009374 [Aspergillus melleus]